MTAKQATQEAALQRRVHQFYRLLNQREFDECYVMIDPLVHDDPASVTLLQYRQSLESFLNHFGKVEVQQVTVQLHLDEPSRLYDNRDFAVGQTVWLDEGGNDHAFQERWVRVGRNWYTRSTGFVTPSVGRPLLPDAGKPE